MRQELKVIAEKLTTERARTAFSCLVDNVEKSMTELGDSVKKRRKLSWSEEFAMRCQAEKVTLELFSDAVSKAFLIEFEEIRLQATVKLVAADLQDTK